MRVTEPFLLEPKNRRVLEGKPRPHTSERWLPLFLAPFVAMGLLVAWAAIQEVRLWRAFHQDGVDTQGVVTRLWTDRDDQGESFHVAYRYAVEPSVDCLHTGNATIDRKRFEVLQRGEGIPIRYLKTNATRSWVIGEESFGGLLFFAFVWNLLLGLLLRFAAKRPMRLRRLRRGRLCSGELIWATATSDTDGDYCLNIQYRFTSPDGDRVNGAASRIRNDLRNQSLPRPGTPVVVQYADDGDNEPL
jgi:hypothetical protein